MRILVLGAGAWGTALAINAAGQSGGHRDVTLWARDRRQAQLMSEQRENARYLPGHGLPPTLAISHAPLDGPDAPQQLADVIVIGTPMAALRDMLWALQGVAVPVVWLCKGFESAQTGANSGLMGHEVCAAVAPRLKAGVLSGPSFAQEVARGQPTALVAASQHAGVRDALVAAFHGPTLRVYANEDIVGVEVGGAVKNVLAIATGLCDGLNLGLNARAALITRGLAEMTRLGLALGADVPVFVRGRNAWAEGVGERLTPIELPPAWYVLAHPGVHAATAALFQAPDLTRNAVPATIGGFLSGTVLDNAFEPVLRRREPAVEALFVALARIGTPRLTGSGSGCFVEFATRESAEAALAALPSGLHAWLARGAERSPLQDAVERFTTGASPSG